MRAFIIAACLVLGAALVAPAEAQKAEPKQAAKKKRAKLEKIACRLGTEDEHARIAVLLADGKVESFAYYSKWKPRTCSMDVKREDAFSKWVDTGNTTVVTLIEEKGAFLIDHSPGRYHFIFRDIDRMRYCGMEGKVNGTLTIYRGKPQCEVTGVMEREPPPAAALPAAAKPPEAVPQGSGPQAAPEPRQAAEEEKGGKPADPPSPAAPAPEPAPAAAPAAPAPAAEASGPTSPAPEAPAAPSPATAPAAPAK